MLDSTSHHWILLGMLIEAMQLLNLGDWLLAEGYLLAISQL